eukprot:1224199-Amphidinium_carterae.1
MDSVEASCVRHFLVALAHVVGGHRGLLLAVPVLQPRINNAFARIFRGIVIEEKYSVLPTSTGGLGESRLDGSGIAGAALQKHERVELR